MLQTKPGKGGKKENGKQKDLAIMETQVSILINSEICGKSGNGTRYL